MAARKTLRELTIKNNFMFGAVMCDEENCKEFLEMVLQIPIEHVEVSKEKVLSTIRSIRAFVWMSLQKMSTIHTTMWRCRRYRKRHLENGQGITTVRLTWSFY